MKGRRNLKILAQPDDTTCGPTSLHAVYDYYGERLTLDHVIKSVWQFEDGGTVAVFLGIDALKKGYKVSLYTYDLTTFDPTWFLTKTDLSEKLKTQLKYKHSRKNRIITDGYLEYLELGGEIHFRDISANLIKRYLYRAIPIITGLSSTYLYNCAREIPETNQSDDIKGEPAGHFVVLTGYNKTERKILVADPLKQNPMSKDQYYHVHVNKLINAIMLGVVTYDANLLIIEK